MTPIGAGHQQLGQLLLQAGVIDELQLRSALGHQRQWGGRLGRILLELKFIDEASLASTLAKQLGLESVRIAADGIDPKHIALVPQTVAERYWIFPLAFKDGRGGGELTVAVADPTNLAAVEDIRFHTGKRIKVVVAPESDIEAAIRRFYYGDQTALAGGEAPVAAPPPRPEGEEDLPELEPIVGEALAERDSTPAADPLAELFEGMGSASPADEVAFDLSAPVLGTEESGEGDAQPSSGFAFAHAAPEVAVAASSLPDFAAVAGAPALAIEEAGQTVGARSDGAEPLPELGFENVIASPAPGFDTAEALPELGFENVIASPAPGFDTAEALPELGFENVIASPAPGFDTAEPLPELGFENVIAPLQPASGFEAPPPLHIGGSAFDSPQTASMFDAPTNPGRLASEPTPTEPFVAHAIPPDTQPVVAMIVPPEAIPPEAELEVPREDAAPAFEFAPDAAGEPSALPFAEVPPPLAVDVAFELTPPPSPELVFAATAEPLSPPTAGTEIEERPPIEVAIAEPPGEVAAPEIAAPLAVEQWDVPAETVASPVDAPPEPVTEALYAAPPPEPPGGAPEEVPAPPASELPPEAGLPGAPFTEGELQILDSLEARVATAGEPAQIIKPGELVSALIRLMIKRGLLSEAELIEELQKR